MKILNLESGTPFSMGKGRNWSVLNPGVGADSITLNHALHGAGHEFPQHIHDRSIDIIVVLEGIVQLRQGEHYTPLEVGEAALVPSGEVHGTVNRSSGTARLISFQIPPDLALYRGERNKAEGETPKPQEGGESNVEIAAMAKGGPRFVVGAEVRGVFSPVRSSPSARLDHVRLEVGQEYRVVNTGTEAVLILLSGEARLEAEPQASAEAGEPRRAGEQRELSRFDVVFLKGREAVRLLQRGSATAVLVHCTALV
jgi:mannose-6-phosphate isomerase-like protein (cupin superfamily)